MKQAIVVTCGWALLLWACQTKTQQDKTSKPEVAAADSLSIDLRRYQKAGLLGKTSVVVVNDDPVFHQKKRYEAIRLTEVLGLMKGFKHVDASQTYLVFECEDGYNPSVLLEKVLRRQSYLAIKDADAPQGKDWIEPIKDGRSMKIAPFYVVYTDVPATDYSYKWPYNLVSMRLAPKSNETAAIFPDQDDTVVQGYDLFKTHCLTCHALNNVGGKMGPELNIPMNVTEYWQMKHLKAFIVNPAAYRKDCKMPTLSYLKEKEVDEILRYLQYMALHKKASKQG